jgi:hypothetical protein
MVMQKKISVFKHLKMLVFMVFLLNSINSQTKIKHLLFNSLLNMNKKSIVVVVMLKFIQLIPIKQVLPVILLITLCSVNKKKKTFILFFTISSLGPDICGFDKKKVHVIFTYKGKNLLIKKDIKCKDDEFTHLYTLILNSDNTYEVRIDNEKVESGKLEEDWDFSVPKRIPDPSASKPSDWVDEEKIDDSSETKPSGKLISNK